MHIISITQNKEQNRQGNQTSKSRNLSFESYEGNAPYTDKIFIIIMTNS